MADQLTPETLKAMRDRRDIWLAKGIDEHADAWEADLARLQERVDGLERAVTDATLSFKAIAGRSGYGKAPGFSDADIAEKWLVAQEDDVP